MIRFKDNTSGHLKIDFIKFDENYNIISKDFLFINNMSKYWNECKQVWILDDVDENYLCLKYPQLVYKIKDDECL